MAWGRNWTMPVLHSFTKDWDPSQGKESHAGKWKGTTVAVKILEHSAESSSGIKELRESVLSSSIIHPNVVSTYKIRTIPAASRKAPPKVEPVCRIGSPCLFSPLTLMFSPPAVHYIDPVVSSPHPCQRSVFLLPPSPTSGHVMIRSESASMAACEHSA